jgi:hypothetical protein
MDAIEGVEVEISNDTLARGTDLDDLLFSTQKKMSVVVPEDSYQTTEEVQIFIGNFV